MGRRAETIDVGFVGGPDEGNAVVGRAIPGKAPGRAANHTLGVTAEDTVQAFVRAVTGILSVHNVVNVRTRIRQYLPDEALDTAMGKIQSVRGGDR